LAGQQPVARFTLIAGKIRHHGLLR
jgi:hypothetical protein